MRLWNYTKLHHSQTTAGANHTAKLLWNYTKLHHSQTKLRSKVSPLWLWNYTKLHHSQTVTFANRSLTMLWNYTKLHHSQTQLYRRSCVATALELYEITPFSNVHGGVRISTWCFGYLRIYIILKLMQMMVQRSICFGYLRIYIILKLTLRSGAIDGVLDIYEFTSFSNIHDSNPVRVLVLDIYEFTSFSNANNNALALITFWISTNLHHSQT